MPVCGDMGVLEGGAGVGAVLDPGNPAAAAWICPRLEESSS